MKLGKRTFFGHIHAIWESPEGKDLENGVKETAAPTVEKIEHGVKAGLKAMHDGDAGSAPAPTTAP